MLLSALPCDLSQLPRLYCTRCRSPQFSQDRAEVMCIKAVVTTSSEKFGGKSLERLSPGHAVRPAHSALVVHQPAHFSLQPSRPDTDPVAADVINRKPGGPLPDQQGEIDSRARGVLDRPGQPGVDLHQQRTITGVPAELHLAYALEADSGDEVYGGAVDVGRDGYALAHDRDAAEGRMGPVRDVRATRDDLAVDDEQRYSLAAPAGPFLSQHPAARG